MKGTLIRKQRLNDPDGISQGCTLHLRRLADGEWVTGIVNDGADGWFWGNYFFTFARALDNFKSRALKWAVGKYATEVAAWSAKVEGREVMKLPESNKIIWAKMRKCRAFATELRSLLEEVGDDIKQLEDYVNVDIDEDDLYGHLATISDLESWLDQLHINEDGTAVLERGTDDDG